MENNPKQFNINEIYAYLVNKANNRLRKLDYTSDREMYDHIGNCLSKISQLFLRVKKSEIDFNVFSDLELLTFRDVQIDSEILALIDERIKRCSIKPKLFIRKHNNSESIYMTTNRENEFIKWSIDGISLCEISEEELEKDFMLLDGYLNSENLVWTQVFTTKSVETLLYRIGNERILSFSENYFKGKKRITIMPRQNISFYQESPCFKSDNWKNPDFIKAEIIRKINEELLERPNLNTEYPKR